MIRDEASVGRVALALSIAGLGAAAIVVGDFLGLLQLVPAWFPARAIVADVVGALFLLGAVGMVMPRNQQVGAKLVVAMLLIVAVVLDVPFVITNIHGGGEWTLLGEAVALASGAAIIAAPEHARLSRIGFAITLPIFACLHYFFHDYVASVIPSWIPAPSLLAYATGVAMLVAGLAMLTGIGARLAATLTAVMFGLWFAILHVPRVVANPLPGEWASMFICLGMSGSAWLVRSKL